MNCFSKHILMLSQKLSRINVKKAQLLIDKQIGDKNRLEQIQLKLGRGLPLLSENQAYLNALILENLSTEEINAIVKEVEEAKLENFNLVEKNHLHCICCGMTKPKLDGGGICDECFYDYRIKISKFLTKPVGNLGIWF